MSSGDILYVFVVLLLLLVGVYLVVYVMKKLMFRYDNSSIKNIGIDLIAVRGIMPKKYVGIVKVKDDYYLLGISDTNITMLDKLDAEKFSDLDFNETNQDGKFSSLLKNAFAKNETR